MIRKRQQTDRAFTLVEVLIASVIFTLLISALYTSFRVSMQSYRETDRRSEFTLSSYYFAKTVRDDFQHIVIDESSEEVFFKSESRAALSGGAEWECIFFRDISMDDSAAGAVIPPARVQYFLNRKEHSDSRYRLYRRITSAVAPDPDGGAAVLLSDSIQEFSVVFYKDGEIYRQWDAYDALPDAVVMTAVLDNETVTLYIHIPLGKRDTDE